METDEELIKQIRQVNEAGYRLEIHAIGKVEPHRLGMATRCNQCACVLVQAIAQLSKC